MIQEVFQVAAGSIVGTDHIGTPQVLLGKNNQDAVKVVVKQDYIVAVMCDGCGTGSHSEVGANIGAAYIARQLEALATRYGSVPFETICSLFDQLFERVRQDTLAQLRVLALGMGEHFSDTVQDYFLFTVVAALITERWSAIVTLGDGVFSLNGETVYLGSGPTNEPVYLAYSLTGSTLENQNPEVLKFKTQRLIKTEKVEQLLIATDGAAAFPKIAERFIPGKQSVAGNVDQFFSDSFFSNPDALRRRLVLLNTRKTKISPDSSGLAIEEGLLPDDTTLVVIRRTGGKGAVSCTVT